MGSKQGLLMTYLYFYKHKVDLKQKNYERLQSLSDKNKQLPYLNKYSIMKQLFLKFYTKPCFFALFDFLVLV